MKIYSDKVNAEDIREALRIEKQAGRIDQGVYFKTLTATSNRSGYKFATEVQLEGYEKNRGRRHGNSGSYGSMGGSDYAATYDEWGWLIAALYQIDSKAVWGSPTHPQYEGLGDFEHKTGRTYRHNLAEEIEANGDPYPFRMGRNLIGRRGAGRSAYATGSWGTRDERSADWARKFYAGEVY